MAEHGRAIRRHAKHYFMEHGLDADAQTRLTLFLQSVKSLNAAILARVEFQPFEWLPYKFLHNQYFKEVELSTLLGKGTQWSANPLVYFAATNLNLALWRDTGAAKYLSGFFRADDSFYEYLALSHAFMAEIRLLPLLPPTMPLDTPFLSALKEIEEENGRQIQTQIRLLKDLDTGLSLEAREEVVESRRAVVAELFETLLAEVSGAPSAEGG